MENRKRSRVIPVELIHRIQSLMPANEVARTCVVSKSWLHAWSTIPTLRLTQRAFYHQERIDRTLLRYHTDNIPIESFDLSVKISNQESAFLAEKWIRHVASKSCLKELSLNIWSFLLLTLPNEIFSGKNLDTINIRAHNTDSPFRINNDPPTVINCDSLRVLNLHDVDISEDLFHNLLSKCRLLEKINLSFWFEGVKSIKVKNLPCLRELKILTMEEDDILEISHVPNLSVFHYVTFITKPLPFNMDSLGSVRELLIHGVIMDNAFFDMIKSKFPSLESLDLELSYLMPENLAITSGSIKKLTLEVCVKRAINIQVYAPNLLFCVWISDKIVPSFSFPDSAPGQVTVICERS